ncbi:ATP-grasp domain-containing protein [Kitasatospora sp. NPDC093806]|uniref:ATP-grasp domain-containing protein n=1 Tax=Kitasatospora sp. NPDC093806 TaxID=3155075 RepID=UPI0034154A51
MAARAEVHILAIQPLPTHTADLWSPHVTEITEADPRPGESIVDLIVRQAEKTGADALFTLSEFAAIAVAEAARRLGLRGSGPHTTRSRDKRRMREVWEAAGVPVPRFRTVSSEDELRTAYAELTPPMLLKAAWGAGSIGQFVIESPEQIAEAWRTTAASVSESARHGMAELRIDGTERDFLVEEIIPGSTRTWWPEDSGYGDYLSVEGIVADGTYHPLCITARIPTIAPFTELSNLCPAPLPEELQRRVEEVARAAVDALELESCGTHTEIKLMDDGGLSVIESAARFGGVMVTAEIEHVYGYDPIGMLIDSLLGREVEFPERMLTPADARGAAGSLSLIATDSAGTPWGRELVWDPERVDWPALLSPGSRIEAVRGLTVAPGTPMPRYDVAAGVLGYGGIFFLRTADAAALVRDSYSVLDNLESELGS